MATRLRLFALGVGRQQWQQQQRTALWLSSSRFSTSSSLRSNSSPTPPLSSSSSPGEPDNNNNKKKKTSPHVGFYQVYGRALSKVMLMSLLVYQGIYYGWMYLEHLEVKHAKEGI
ncbi:hypothetical protein TWF718_010217 [Orbilia javanica]|uniref:Uncharacterized protein n=1 Tax=Orbilia javanica TaxID=47235 RepID=A0AAN8MU12_9PEZI